MLYKTPSTEAKFSLDPRACEGCEKLESYIANESSENFASVDGVLYSKNKEILYSYPVNKAGTSYTTDISTVIVSDYAFYFNKNLLSLEFTSGVVDFGEYLAYGSLIKTVTINSDTVTLNENTFTNTSLEKIRGHIASDAYVYASNHFITFESLCELTSASSEDGKTKYIKTTDCNSVLIEVSEPEDSFYTSKNVEPEIYNPYSLEIETKYTDLSGTEVDPINVGVYVATITYEGISIVYQYSIEKADPFVVAPVSLDAEYGWRNQIIITSGSTTGGHLEYKLDGGEWSTSLPVAKEPGTYIVWYKVVGNENYNDVAPISFEAKIIKATLKVVDPVAKTGLKYNGQVQYLIEEGSSNIGLMSYKLDDGEWPYVSYPVTSTLYDTVNVPALTV